MKRYPAFLDLRGRPCVVIGGGPVAERKARSLLAAGAAVAVVSPSLTPSLAGLAGSGAITHRKKEFEERDLEGAAVVIAAADSPAVNTAAARYCRARNILVNVAAPPGEGNFIVPSVVERGDLTIAVSTGGASPALSRRIRQELEQRYGPEYGTVLEKLAALRARLLEEVPDEAVRREIFQAIADSDALGLLRENKARDADHRIEEIIRRKRGQE